MEWLLPLDSILLEELLQDISMHGLLLEVDGSLPPIFAKSETIENIKIIITHHLYIFKRYAFSQNLEDVPKK